MLNLFQEHLHFESKMINIEMIKTRIFQNTKKSKIIAKAREINAIADNFDDIVKVK